jgi:hypothetical protein
VHHQISESDFNRLFREWYTTATEEEIELSADVEEYTGLYFGDMTFSPDSILHDFLYFRIHGDYGERGETISFPDDLDLSLSCYRFKIAELEGYDGKCNAVQRIITITPKRRKDVSVIVHEMIHAFEEVLLREKYLTYRLTLRDLLTFALYKKLKPQISDLDERILNHAHLLRQEDIIREGGSHGILFFLKSLDLDLQLDMKLGTVCSYGRDKFSGMNSA